MVFVSPSIYILYICVYVRVMFGIEAVREGIFRSIVDESNENEGAKFSALRNTTGEELPLKDSRAILYTLKPGCKEVSNPRDDLTPHTKTTQLLDSTI